MEDREMTKAEQFASTGDRRTVNNSDAVRHNYRVLTDEEKKQVAAIKNLGEEFLSLCDVIGSSRELSVAKTNIEQAVMWAVKYVTRP
jgi:hypothetical protein